MPAVSPWIWGRNVDLLVFGGSALAALALVPLGPALSEAGSVPTWGFFVLVVAVDVAHVWTTLFRTYLDGEEVRQRPSLYLGVPLLCLAGGVALHLASPQWFWRVLAYTAVFHFVRQQAGWVAVYRARAGAYTAWDRVTDDAAIYLSTLFPLVYWHAHLPRGFEWFVEGDFASFRIPPWAVSAAGALEVVALAAYAVRALVLAARGKHNAGKHLVVATTAATWFTGVVATNSDFQFTSANVIVHGVPYVALLYFYARERGLDRPGGLIARGMELGFVGFYAIVIVLAFAEEMIWDRSVWHAHPALFGGSADDADLGRVAKSIVVPLLAVPQATHYVLDAVLWRKKDSRGTAGRAQAAALGFRVRRSG